MFSLKLLAPPSISNIVAFEPNGEGFRWLKLNLGRLKMPVQVMNAAAADFEGTGRLYSGGAIRHPASTKTTRKILLSRPLMDP